MNRPFGLFLGLSVWMLMEASAQNRPQFGITAFPNISGARLAASSTLNNAEIDSLEAREISRPSLSLGLAVQWRGLKAGFRTGLQFTDTGYRSIREPIPPGDPAPDNALTRSIMYRNYHIEIPAELLFTHEISDDDRVNFMMGFSAAYNISNVEETDFFGGEKIGRARLKLSNDNFRRLHMAFITGIGWQHDFGEKIIFFAQPTFQFWFNGLLLDASDVNRNLYAIGLKTGILFNTDNN